MAAKTDDGKVFVRSKTGALYKTDAASAKDLIARGEYDAATPEQVQARTAERESSTLGAAGRGLITGTVGGVLAAPKLATALGSAALGQQDPLAEISGRKFYEDMAAAGRHLGGGDLAAEDEARAAARDQLLADEEAHPYATGAGELAGNVLGAGVGGLGAGARAAGGLIARGAGALGAGARLAPALGGIATGVLEGGAFGADAASEAAWVKNAPVTAQQSLAAIGLGALFGGGLSAGAAGLSKLPAVARLLQRGEAVEGLEGAAAGEEAGAGRSILAAEEKAGPAAIDRVPEGLMAKGRAWVNDWSDREVVDAIGRGNKRALGEFKTAAQKEETGALIHEMNIAAPGRSEAGMFEAAEQAVAKQNGQFSKIHAALDKEAGYVDGVPLLNKLEDVARKIETEGPLAGSPEAEAAAKMLRDRVDKMIRPQIEEGILTHQETHNFRRYLDNIGYGTGHAEHMVEAAQEARRVVSDVLAEEIKKASPDLAQEWALANKRYGAAVWARDTLAKRVSGNASGGTFGLKDLLAGGALAAANPLAAIPVAIGSKLLRERGASTFASIAKKTAGDAVDVSSAPAVATPTARKLAALVASSTEQVESGIGQFLGGVREGIAGRTTRAASSLVGRMRSTDIADARAAYADHVREVQTVATSPEVAADRMAGITGSTIPLYAPGLHAEMVATATRGAQYLASVAPAPAQDPNTITPQVKTPPPVSAADMRTYAARVEGVENPLSLLNDMNSLKGVRAEKVEAVKAVHPELYEQMRQSLFTHLAERTTPVPRRMRTTLELTFDANGTIDPSFAPQNLAVMQQAAQALAAEGAQKAKAPAPKASGMLATRSNQISGGLR
jgi:hypothetical protein